MLRFLFLLTGLLIVGGLRPAHAQRLEWSQITTLGGDDQQTGQPDELTDLAVDGAGNVYVTGVYTFGTQLGSVPWPFDGRLEGFVAKFNAAGAFQWVRTLIGPGDERVASVCIGPNGACYITGNHDVNATLDGGISRRSGRGVFVASFDGQGNQLWVDTSVSLPPQSPSYLYLNEIAVSPRGECYAAGFAIDDVQFGPLLYAAPPGVFSNQIFVVKYVPNRTPEWIKGSAILGSSTTIPVGLLADSAGCYVATEYDFTAGTLFGTAVPPTTRPARDIDGAVIALDSAGTPRWVQTINNPGADYRGDVSLRIQFAPHGKLLAVGNCDSMTIFSGTPPTILRTRAGKDYSFAARYDAATGQLDTVRLLAQGVTNTTAVGSFARGQLLESPTGTYLAGSYRGTVAFGQNGVQRSSRSLFGSALVARFNPDGTCSDVLTNRSGSRAYIQGIHQLLSGSLLVVGAFYDSLDTNLPKRYPRGPNDLFIAQLSVVTGLPAATPAPTGALLVWPNPARQEVAVELPATAGPRPAQVVLRDVLGRQVLAQGFTGRQTRLSLLGVPPGVYLLEARWVGGTATRRVVVEQ